VPRSPPPARPAASGARGHQAAWSRYACRVQRAHARTRVRPGGRARSRKQIIEANWKIVVENFLECYHCPVAHKSFSRLIDVDPDAYTLSTARWTSSQYGPPQAGDDLPTTPPATCAPGTPDEIIEEITSFSAEVGAEDRELVESVHRGLRSGAIHHGRLLLGSEKLIQHFQLLVYDALDENSSPRTNDPQRMRT